MQVAEILSDLTSLRACGHNEAMALVNVHKETSPSKQGDSQPTQEITEDGQNRDLQRAKDLIDLHYNVKMKHMHGQPGVVDEDLRRAREDVTRVLMELDG